MMPHEQSQEMARLLPFPGVPAGGELTATVDAQPPVTHQTSAIEVAPPVIDAELMTPEDEAELAARRTPTTVVVQVVQVVRVGATHPRTIAALAFLGRHGAYVIKGAEQARQRRRAERGQTDLKSARAAAAKTGDHATVVALTSQIEAARKAPIEAINHHVEAGWLIVKRGGIVGGGTLGGSLLVATVNSACHVLGPWGVLDELHAIGAVITTTTDIVGWCGAHWTLFPLTGVGVWLFRRWKDGIRLGEQVLPERLRSSDGRTGAQPALTENLLIRALANIGHRNLSAAIKSGWPNREGENAWVRPPMPEARGWGAQLQLPMGASIEEIGKKKSLLAHNLKCIPAELFLDPSEEDPTVLDLFRLDHGVLREPVPDYPLLDEGTTNYWDGFPIGVSPRGGEVTGYVFERNYVVSGIMGSGKTTHVITLLCGAILDPLVDVDVWVFADNEDYTQLEPALRLFRKGDTAENVEGLLEYFDGLNADLEVRGQLLRKCGVTSVTREAAAREPGLRPRVVVIDECQSFFRQDTPEMRRRVVNLVTRYQSKARKYGVTLVFATPSPSDQNLPRDLVAVTSNRACYAIGDKTRNNVVLGDKAHENGISALGLKPKTKRALNDVGTFVGVGYLDNGPGTVRTYLITPEQQRHIVERALVARNGTTATADVEVPVRDLLVDLAEVLGSDPMPAAQCAELLRGLAPDHRPYRELTRDLLVARLADAGVRVPSTGNRWPVGPEAVRDALRGRTAELEAGDAG